MNGAILVCHFRGVRAPIARDVTAAGAESKDRDWSQCEVREGSVFSRLTGAQVETEHLAMTLIGTKSGR